MSSKKETRVKKQLTALATSTLVTVAREEAVEDGKNPRSQLARVLYIQYLINIKKKFMLVFFDWSSKVNAIYLTFAKELGLFIRPTDVGAQKIDDTMLDTYEIVIVAFSMKDKANQIRFLEETFLMANVSPEIVFKMPFFILGDADIDFLGRELWWKTHTTKKVFPTIRRIKLVDKKKFAAAALDPEHET